MIESGVSISGSIERVLSGKHHKRAMRVHKLTLEALEQLLFKYFQQSEYVQALIEGASAEECRMLASVEHKAMPLWRSAMK